MKVPHGEPVAAADGKRTFKRFRGANCWLARRQLVQRSLYVENQPRQRTGRRPSLSCTLTTFTRT